MHKTANEFSLSGYRALITRFRELGYACQPFTESDLQPDARQLLLRHDIDICPARAAALARCESELGVSSLYCILVSSPLYNPFSRENISHIRELVALGHTVGLHFDVTVYHDDGRPPAPERLAGYVAAEARTLSEIARTPIRVMSFHRPAKSLQGMAERIAGLIHTYEPRFFSEIGYVSDSGGEWRYGHPFEHRSVREGGALQLLTHPVWWARTKPSDSPFAALDEAAVSADASYRLALAETCRAYRARFPDRAWKKPA